MNGDEQSAPVPRPRKAKGIVLLALIAAALYIGVHGAIRGWELQRRMVCVQNLKGVGTALKIYAGGEWDGSRPFLDWFVSAYPDAQRWIECPGRSARYIVVPYPPSVMANLRDDAVLAYEPKSNHGGEGGNILFADGHASFVPVPAYDALIAAIPEPPPSSPGASPP